MSSWLYLAILAQFLFAISVLIDKHIVARAAHIGKPAVYAFYTALLSGVVILAAPFVPLQTPTSLLLLLSLINAATFVVALYLMYSALSVARASDVAPVVGGVSAIVAVVLAAVWIEGDVTHTSLLPVLFLASGTALISHFHFSRRAIMLTLCSGLFFGVTAVLAKIIFDASSFYDGFFWTRAMNVIVALSLLAVPALRAAILHGGMKSSTSAKSLVLGNKVIAGGASILMALAVSVGPVSTVNALGGLQFVFLFAFAILFARHMPLFSESKSGDHGGWHTAAGVTLIVLGLAALYIS